jgi:hypothetical protein
MPASPIRFTQFEEPDSFLVLGRISEAAIMHPQPHRARLAMVPKVQKTLAGGLCAAAIHWALHHNKPSPAITPRRKPAKAYKIAR